MIGVTRGKQRSGKENIVEHEEKCCGGVGLPDVVTAEICFPKSKLEEKMTSIASYTSLWESRKLPK